MGAVGVEGGGRWGWGGGIANHIMGHEINPPSPNIWPSLRLTLEELFSLFFFFLVLVPQRFPSTSVTFPLNGSRCSNNGFLPRPAGGSLLKRHPSAAADDTS